MTSEEDVVSFHPDLTGLHGRGWIVDMEKFVVNKGKDPAMNANVVTWLVEAPWAHPLWHSYIVACVHLRELPGGPETLFYLPGATHELWVYALSSDIPRDEVLTGQGIPTLEPINYASQFIAKSDAAAAQRIEEVVRGVLAGVISPDTDYRQQWVSLFGDNMIRK